MFLCTYSYLLGAAVPSINISICTKQRKKLQAEILSVWKEQLPVSGEGVEQSDKASAALNWTQKNGVEEIVETEVDESGSLRAAMKSCFVLTGAQKHDNAYSLTSRLVQLYCFDWLLVCTMIISKLRMFIKGVSMSIKLKSHKRVVLKTTIMSFKGCKRSKQTY